MHATYMYEGSISHNSKVMTMVKLMTECLDKHFYMEPKILLSVNSKH